MAPFSNDHGRPLLPHPLPSDGGDTLAAFEQVFSFHLQPSARHNWMTFKCPLIAAFAQVRVTWVILILRSSILTALYE
jgi:hypothetical protein